MTQGTYPAVCVLLWVVLHTTAARSHPASDEHVRDTAEETDPDDTGTERMYLEGGAYLGVCKVCVSQSVLSSECAYLRVCVQCVWTSE